jgi:hypothetical protein
MKSQSEFIFWIRKHVSQNSEHCTVLLSYTEACSKSLSDGSYSPEAMPIRIQFENKTSAFIANATHLADEILIFHTKYGDRQNGDAHLAW